MSKLTAGIIISVVSFASSTSHLVLAQPTPEISSANPQMMQQMKQSSAVLSIAFSPDGKYLASSGQDSKVRLWDVATGQLNKILSGPPQIHAIRKIVFAANGKQLASVSDKVRLWDVATGQIQRSFAVANPNPFEVKNYGQGFGMSVALSPENDMIASTGQFLTVHSQNQNGDWKQVFQQKFFYGTVTSFTPDGTTLIEAGWNGRLNLWSVAALKHGEAKPQDKLPQLQGQPYALGKANSLSLSADGALMVIGYGYEGGVLTKTSTGTQVQRKDDGKIVLWDLTTGKVKQSWTVPNAAVLSVALSRDGKSVASASEDKQVRLWNVATGQLRYTLTENTEVNAVAFSPDGATLVSSSSDGVIKLRHLKE